MVRVQIDSSDKGPERKEITKKGEREGYLSSSSQRALGREAERQDKIIPLKDRRESSNAPGRSRSEECGNQGGGAAFAVGKKTKVLETKGSQKTASQKREKEIRSSPLS